MPLAAEEAEVMEIREKTFYLEMGRGCWVLVLQNKTTTEGKLDEGSISSEPPTLEARNGLESKVSI